MLLLMFRHALRVSEAIGLRLSDVDLSAKTIYVKRLKNSISGAHPLYGGEVSAIRDWLGVRQQMLSDAPGSSKCEWLFVSERRKPLNRGTVWAMIQKLAEAAGLEDLAVHPHSLRHSAGFNLASKGIDTRLLAHYMGHRNLQNSAVYTALAPARFQNLF